MRKTFVVIAAVAVSLTLNSCDNAESSDDHAGYLNVVTITPQDSTIIDASTAINATIAYSIPEWGFDMTHNYNLQAMFRTKESYMTLSTEFLEQIQTDTVTMNFTISQTFFELVTESPLRLVFWIFDQSNQTLCIESDYIIYFEAVDGR